MHTPTRQAHVIREMPSGFATCYACPDTTIRWCDCGRPYCLPHGNEHIAGHRAEVTS